MEREAIWISRHYELLFPLKEKRFMDEMIDKKHANPEEMIRYVPYQEVLNPNKYKNRIPFDCTSLYKIISINQIQYLFLILLIS